MDKTAAILFVLVVFLVAGIGGLLWYDSLPNATATPPATPPATPATPATPPANNNASPNSGFMNGFNIGAYL